jgi:hypothetical protein
MQGALVSWSHGMSIPSLSNQADKDPLMLLLEELCFMLRLW